MIDVVHEPEGLGPAERCCFCRLPTRFWCEAIDVACCPRCATDHTVADMPTKEEWCAKERELAGVHGQGARSDG
jgi:hypothetical protein